MKESFIQSMFILSTPKTRVGAGDTKMCNTV